MKIKQKRKQDISECKYYFFISSKAKTQTNIQKCLERDLYKNNEYELLYALW